MVVFAGYVVVAVVAGDVVVAVVAGYVVVSVVPAAPKMVLDTLLQR